MRKYSILLAGNPNGWTAVCPVLPGCVSQGDTRDQALLHIQDAIRLYLRAVRKEMRVLKQNGRTIVRVAA